MATRVARLVSIISFFVALIGCQEDDQPDIPNYLYATPNSVTLSAGRDTTVTLSGGVPPYRITQKPSPNVAVATLQGSIVTIHGVGPPDTRMTVADTVQNAAIITITVLSDSTNLMDSHEQYRLHSY
ncbi:MAG: hypothetical protein HY707_03130 [Ignavibacteriae bacterium]|nr:hypothetical protein [Ignavibacteriota bacterium]